MDTITYLGVDVHKANRSQSPWARAGATGEVSQVGVFENRPAQSSLTMFFSFPPDAH